MDGKKIVITGAVLGIVGVLVLLMVLQLNPGDRFTLTQKIDHCPNIIVTGECMDLIARNLDCLEETKEVDLEAEGRFSAGYCEYTGEYLFKVERRHAEESDRRDLLDAARESCEPVARTRFQLKRIVQEPPFRDYKVVSGPNPPHFLGSLPDEGSDTASCKFTFDVKLTLK